MAKSKFQFRCPRCKGDRIDVIVEVWAKLEQFGDDDISTDTDATDDGSHNWNGDSPMQCTNGTCGFVGKCDDFDTRLTKKAKKEQLLQRAAELQTKYWEAVGALQAAVGFNIDGTKEIPSSLSDLKSIKER